MAGSENGEKLERAQDRYLETKFANIEEHIQEAKVEIREARKAREDMTETQASMGTQVENNTKNIGWLWKTVVGLTVLSGAAAGIVKALP